MRQADCLTCKTRAVYRRGCCIPCYRLHASRVMSRKITWEELITAGLATAGVRVSLSLKRDRPERKVRGG